MARFNTTDRRLWSDARFLRLSEQGKLLWLYLLTGPEVTNLPGVIVAGRMQIAEVLKWLPERFGERFGELFREGMAKADWDARLIWLPNATKYNSPANINVVKGWRDTWDNVPECQLKAEVFSHLKAVFHLETGPCPRLM